MNNDFDYFKKEHDELNEKLSFINRKTDEFRDDISAILDGRYVTPLKTGINRLDSALNLFYGMLMLVSGFPQSGKSEFVNFLAVYHACNQRGKVNIFSPENDTALLMVEITNTVKHLMQINFGQAKEFVNEWFLFKEIRDNNGMPDITHLVDDFTDLSNQGFNFFIIDPMNWVTSSLYTSSGMFESLRLTLTSMKQFAKKTKSIMVYVEHPKTPQPNRDGTIPMCSIFSVNGGVMHNNKIDAGVILHRQRQIDEYGKAKSSQNDPVLLEVSKLKFQKYLGTPDNILLNFDFKTGIYS